MPRNLLGLSSFVLASPFSDDDRLAYQKVASFGYDAIEVCVEDPALLTADGIAEAAAEAGLKAGICATFGPDRDLSNEDPARRAAGVAYMKACVDLAAAVGSPHVAGPMYAKTGRARPLAPEARRQEWLWAAESIREVADHAGQQGVRLAIEPLNRFETDLVNTIDQALELCVSIGRANVGLCLDTFHMNIEEKDIAAAVRAAADHVFHVQVSENDRGIPGSGHVPWAAFFGALTDVDYAGQIILEGFMQTGPIAGLAKVWRPLAPSMDALAADGLAFLRTYVR